MLAEVRNFPMQQGHEAANRNFARRPLKGMYQNAYRSISAKLLSNKPTSIITESRWPKQAKSDSGDSVRHFGHTSGAALFVLQPAKGPSSSE